MSRRRIQNANINGSSRSAKPSSSSQGFVEGSIVRIKLENFVTYDSVEFWPGPQLNVIIGPNGTGKSTIVCAICLGLAGKTSLLGRAAQPVEYIKHGCEKAVIEIELYNPKDKNYTIKREINKANQSTWSVNNCTATQKAVELTVSRLNIQVGNLCQFLPQDKVADFAKMSPQELLENTEKAVGYQDMYENHCRLKTAREESRKLELAYNNTKETLEREKQKNDRLEQDVKNYEERQRHLEKIKILQMKRPWVEYEEKRKQYQAEKEMKETLAEKVKHARQQNTPLQQKMTQAKQKVAAVDSQMKKMTDQVKEHARHAASKSKAIEEQTDHMVEAQDELKGKKAEEARRQKQLREMQKQLESVQNDLANLEDDQDVQPQIEKCQQDIRKTSQEITKLNHEGEVSRGEKETVKKEINALQSELRKIQDINNRRFENMRQKNKHAYDATLWLRANRHLFKSTIHEPMMLIIDLKSPEYAKYIESHIAMKDMFSFVCEDVDDMNKFMNIVRDEQHLKINAGLAPQQPLSAFKPDNPISNLKKFGFHSYLKDLFDCPDAVMRYLCLLYKVHSIPVGNHDTKKHVESVISANPHLSTFYTENHQYNIKRSKYGSKQVSSRCSELRKPGILQVSVDVTRERDITQQLKERQAELQAKEQEYREMQSKYKGLETLLNRLRDEKKKLMEQKDIRRSLQQKINMKKQRIDRLESEAIDLATEEKKTVRRIQQINLRKLKNLEDLQEHTEKCLNMSIHKVRLSLQHAFAISEANRIEAEVREQSITLQNLEREFEQLKERVKSTKDTARKLLDIAKKATNTDVHEDLSQEMRTAFETCPATVEEIDAAMHEEQARADCTFQTDEGVIDEYHKRKRDISRLRVEEERKRDSLETHNRQIEEIKTRWFEPLQELVSQINDNFSSFFKQMKCAGEVDLSVPANPEDYEKYGVRIKVKYRDNEQLRELTPFHQSGGERSVATVLYMMALQELTKCPFRCVDEINQGMDPQNERKVFELVVETACRENTPQYFLLTPKLLPDLEYSNNMTVLCVYNGVNMINHCEWNMRKFLKRRSRLE